MHKTLALIPALALIACEPVEECTEEARSSVNVQIQDLDGQALAATAVTYTVDGGSEQDAECLSEPCTEWVAGWEVAGEFEITVLYEEVDPGDELCSRSGSAVETVTVGMTEDGCHVESEALVVQLDPEYLCADS